jgi:hypothetical protein
MWVIGGGGSPGYMNDVWSSIDGISWTQSTSAASWAARNLHTSVVYNNKMWVMGGDAVGGGWMNDVWSSIDGSSWTTSAASWAGRYGLTSVVYDNKMWVMGGDASG